MCTVILCIFSIINIVALSILFIFSIILLKKSQNITLSSAESAAAPKRGWNCKVTAVGFPKGCGHGGNSKLSHLTLFPSLNAQIACSAVVKAKTKRNSYSIRELFDLLSPLAASVGCDTRWHLVAASVLSVESVSTNWNIILISDFR